MREIHFIKDRCVECGACKAACIAEHQKNHTIYDTISLMPMAKKRLSGNLLNSMDDVLPHPVRCVHCEEPVCVEACISGAMKKTDNRVNSKWGQCVGCFMCVMTCPYGAILPFFGKAIKCDQCLFTEKPACVRACPHNAIVFMEEDEFSRANRKMKQHESPQREAPLMRAKY